MTHANWSRPAPAFSVKETQGGYVVINAKGSRVSTVYSQLAHASRDCNLKLAWSAHTYRPCLCCSKVFRSEGAHNRMCERCRASTSEGLQSQRPCITRGQ